MNKCTILNFSSRENGNCARIGEYLLNYYQNKATVFTIDANNFAPCNTCNYQCLKPEMLCPQLNHEQRKIMDEICNSNLVYFIIPNYCGLPSANYFAFNERSVGYFNLDREKTNLYKKIKKRFIIVSNTEGFDQYMQYQVNNTPDILYLKSSKYRKQSIAGDILDSEDARSALNAFLAFDLSNE